MHGVEVGPAGDKAAESTSAEKQVSVLLDCSGTGGVTGSWRRCWSDLLRNSHDPERLTHAPGPGDLFPSLPTPLPCCPPCLQPGPPAPCPPAGAVLGPASRGLGASGRGCPAWLPSPSPSHWGCLCPCPSCLHYTCLHLPPPHTPQLPFHPPLPSWGPGGACACGGVAFRFPSCGTA